ncbi:MAG: hypothetical protein J3Q66DRAFT_372592 [Benniella sp.]|nr:MAG: hypothetical protein J3Q66DRAFT_372592 [Benniella sp.]
MFGLPELDDVVCQQLSHHALAQCAQVSRKWYNTVIPYLWGDLSGTITYDTWKQRDFFCRMVLEDYLHDQKHRALEEDCRGLEPHAQEHRSSPLSTLAKYGRWIRFLPYPDELRSGFQLHHTLFPPPQGTKEMDKEPSHTELMRHLYQHCPAMRIPSFIMKMNDPDPDDYLKVIAEFVLPCAQHITAEGEGNRDAPGCKEIMDRLDRCSDELEELTIRMRKGLRDDIQGSPEQQEPKPWTNLKRLELWYFDEKNHPESFCSWLRKRCSQAETLTVVQTDGFTGRTMEAMSKHMPNLCKLQLNKNSFDSRENAALFLGRLRTRWKAMELKCIGPLDEDTREALANHFHTLEELVLLNCVGWTSHDLLQVFRSCPRLHTLIYIDTKPHESPYCMDANVFIDRDHHTGLLKEWPCEKTLKRLFFTVTGIPEPDSEQGLEIQNLVYDRLARLTGLETLRFGSMRYIFGENRMTYSQCLKISLESGLEKLAGLKELKELEVSDLRTRVGIKEVQWMVEHWPRLRVLRGVKPEGEWDRKMPEEAVEWLEQHYPGIELE